jgi:hypothetical protein
MAANYRALRPGQHPRPAEPYRYTHRGRSVQVYPQAMSNPLAHPGTRIHEALLKQFLEPALENPSISDEYVSLLGDAVQCMAVASVDSLGLFGPAGYSGPRASSLRDTLRHPTRGDAFAAELIVAAALIDRTSLAGNRPVALRIRSGTDRVDFGVKLLRGSERSRRRTAEADFMIGRPDGAPIAVDVKHTRHGRSYGSEVSASQLEVVTQALERGEIASFHFVTNGHFPPRTTSAIESADAGNRGVLWHEGVWPGRT